MLSRLLRRAGVPAACSLVVVACSSFGDGSAPALGDAGPDDGATDELSASDVGDGGDPSEASPSAMPTVLATGLRGASGIAADDTTVYLLERDIGFVDSVPLAGGALGTVAKTMMAPSSIALTADYVFFSFYATQMVTRVSRPNPLESLTALTTHAPVAIAASVDRLVVASVVPGTNGDVQSLGFDLTVRADVANQRNPFDVAIFAGQIFWTESAAAQVDKGNPAADGAITVAMDESDCESIAADGSGLYWTRPSAGLVQAQLTPGTTVMLAKDQKAPFALAADASGVYWMTTDGALRRSPHVPGTAQTLAQGFDGAFADLHVQAIALTSAYVVWITNDGQVLRLPK